MERAAAYVVPIRIGGGTRLKIYEAMAMEKPIVSTTVGAEGLPVGDGGELLLADTPEAFAEAVVSVLTDEELAQGLGAARGGNGQGQFRVGEGRGPFRGNLRARGPRRRGRATRDSRRACQARR